MPILMTRDTNGALQGDAAACTSRSLFLDRFANPEAKDYGGDTPRRDWFNRLIKLPPEPVAVRSRLAWTEHLSSNGHATILYAQLQARLMVNMAGGVMENAGMCLDRFGMPYIPGSAVKGCARRAAIQSLLNAPSPKEKSDALFNTALVFGWGTTDWIPGRRSKQKNGQDIQTEPHSDFWWAMAPDTGKRHEDDKTRNAIWSEVAGATGSLLIKHLRLKRSTEIPNPVQSLPNFAGSVSFLPAHPVDLGVSRMDGLPMKPTSPGTLELDVVTCHHPTYYSSKHPQAIARDDEEPNPVTFPAVAPGHVFAFTLLPLKPMTDHQINFARGCLEDGLRVFGIGAKTGAGYGWFECGKEVQETVLRFQKTATENRIKELAKQEEARIAKLKADAAAKEHELLSTLTAGMTPEQRIDFETARLTDEQFLSILEQFTKRNLDQQQSIVRLLRLSHDQSGSRQHFWDKLKAKAKKGGKPAQVEQAIRQVSKQMFPGKEGKMP